jgi:hypothetical protein
MTNKLTKLILIAFIALVLAACSSGSSDVPALNTEDTQVVEPTTDAVDSAPNDEAKMMAFTQCMRDQGVELLDPVVDSDGNIQRPTLVEGAKVTRDGMGAAYDACAKHLEGLTIIEERVNVSEQVNQYVTIATCLRGKGYDVDDPTAETFDKWGMDFRIAFNWDDPAAAADFEECNVDMVNERSE